MQLKNAVAIVTGSSSGIGAATAKALAAKGSNVVVNYGRREAEAKAVVEAIKAAGADAVMVQGDVSDDAVCRKLAQTALDKWGRIDMLVNNAGTTKFVDQRDLDGLSSDDFMRIYGVNVVGPYQMIRACLPAMQKQGDGAVVNVSSTAGLSGQSSSTAYAASKGGLNSLTKALARVLGPELRINAICPGFVDNSWIETQTDRTLYEAGKHAIETITALRRAPTSADIADVILWLLEGANFMTGEIIEVDSGAHLGTTGRSYGTHKT